jgi:thiol-disulfide isomerase/thioredoxin
MNRSITQKPVLAALIAVTASCLWPDPVAGEATNQAAAAALAVGEKEACLKNLKQIYEAIQAYRKDHKQLPDWLSDLVPKYLAAPAVLTCTVTTRTGRGIAFPHLADPKLPCSYLYEFCDGEAGFIFRGGKLKMREFKSLQMGLVGGATPILRCWLHEPILNVGFDGKVFESKDNWEELFSDVVRFDDLYPAKILARLAHGQGALGLLEEFDLRPARPPTVATNRPAPKPVQLPSLKVGDPAPRLATGKWVQGEPVKEFQKGKAYVVEFWATWCGPCRVSIPHLNEIYEQYKDQGLIVIGQDCWERDDELVAPFVKKMGGQMTYRVALDDKAGDDKGKMAQAWMAASGQRGIPTAFLVDTNGVLAWIGHPMGLNSNLVAQVLAGSFDLKKAAEDFARAQQQRAEQIAANDDPAREVDLARANLAKVLQTRAVDLHDQGKLSEAEPLFRELLALTRNAGGRGALPLDIVLSELGTTLLGEGKFSEAEVLYRECLALRQKQMPDAWYTFYTQSRLGRALLGQKKYADAEPLLLAGYEGLKQRQKDISTPQTVLTGALEPLVRLYEATDQPDQAAKWKQDLAEFGKAESANRIETAKH